MSFILPELVIETIIRDGIKLIRDSIDTDDDQIEKVFESLKGVHLNTYYGQSEVDKIKQIIKNNIYIIQGYALGDVKSPYVAINLVTNAENNQQALLDDFADIEETVIEPSTIVTTFDCDTYLPFISYLTRRFYFFFLTN